MPATLRFLSYQFSPRGFNLQFQDLTGQPYWLDATSDFQTWTLLGQFSNTTENIQFVDSNSTRLPQRFYRLPSR